MTLALGVCLAACRKQSATLTDASDEGGKGGGLRGAMVVSDEQAAKVLARVGTKTITVGRFASIVDHMDRFDRLRYQAPERRKELLNELVTLELLAQEAVAKGYDQDPVAQKELRSVLRDTMLKEVHQGSAKPVDLPEGDVRAYFDAHRDDYVDPERRRLSLIVLKSKAQALMVLEKAKSGQTATQWGRLVVAFSVDADAKSDVPLDLAGDVGFTSPPGDPRGDNPRIPVAVRAAAFEIPALGDVLGRVVEDSGRWYLVRLTQRSERHERTFAESERPIRVRLAQEKIRTDEAAWTDKIRASIPVSVDEAALSSVRLPPSE